MMMMTGMPQFQFSGTSHADLEDFLLLLLRYKLAHFKHPD